MDGHAAAVQWGSLADFRHPPTNFLTFSYPTDTLVPTALYFFNLQLAKFRQRTLLSPPAVLLHRSRAIMTTSPCTTFKCLPYRSFRCRATLSAHCSGASVLTHSIANPNEHL